MQSKRLFIVVLSCLFSLISSLTYALLVSSQAFAQEPAFIRVIHASPDIGTVDVFVDGKKFLSSFEFGTVTGYAPVPPGIHKVQLAEIGKGAQAPVITQDLSIDAGTAYTVAGLGTRTTAFTLKVFLDDNHIANDITRVRVYHLSPTMGPASVSTESGLIAQSLSYQQASSYIALTTGTHTFTLSNSTASDTPSLQVNLKPWTITSIFAISQPNNTAVIHLLSAQETGLPGMPQTGSDPTPLSAQPTGSPAIPWWIGCILLLPGLALFVSNRQRRRRKAISDSKE